jgi:proline iminopeptidase
MRVTVNGVAIFFEVIGEKLALREGALVEKPTLLVLHGGPGFDHSGMRGYFDRFSDVAQVVYLDHRANGRSDHGPRSSWNLDQWGDDVAAFCDELEIEHPVVLGHSFGGFVAQSYLARHPSHPSKVILSSTSATCRFDRSLAVYERLGGPDVAAVAARTYAEPSLEAFLEFSMVCSPLYHRRQEVAWPTRPDLMTLEVLIDFWREGAPEGSGSLKTFDLRAGLLRATCPVLVLGGEDDPACPIEDQEDIVAFLPHDLVRFERFADCGHGTYHDAPEATESIIRDFLVG